MTIQIQFCISNKIHIVSPQDFINISSQSFSMGNKEGTTKKENSLCLQHPSCRDRYQTGYQQNYDAFYGILSDLILL